MSTQELAQYEKVFEIARHKYDTFKAQGRLNSGTLALMAALLPLRQAASGGRLNLAQIKEKLNEVRNTPIEAQMIDMSNVKEAKQEAVGSFADADAECSICLELYEEPMQTPCRHIFCRECIVAFLETKNECPYCRAVVTPGQLKKPKSKKKEGAAKTEVNLNIDDGESFEFTTKINYLISELTKLKRDNPKEKVLIFTTFSKTLTKMMKVLDK
eukprot:UN23072